MRDAADRINQEATPSAIGFAHSAQVSSTEPNDDAIATAYAAGYAKAQQESQPAGAANRRPTNNTKKQYCWSCGFQITHDGTKCTRQKPGHIRTATGPIPGINGSGGSTAGLTV